MLKNMSLFMANKSFIKKCGGGFDICVVSSVLTVCDSQNKDSRSLTHAVTCPPYDFLVGGGKPPTMNTFAFFGAVIIYLLIYFYSFCISFCLAVFIHFDDIAKRSRHFTRAY
tara:strand:+ start:29 stop:364 length:336 start_codon:yes stop_codon:yes gene_type:complete